MLFLAPVSSLQLSQTFAMPKEYQLLLDDDVYWHMAQRHYDAALWMNMELVLKTAMRLKRSTMKLEELCMKGAVLKNDILRIQKKFRNDLIVCFSATVGLSVLDSVI